MKKIFRSALFIAFQVPLLVCNSVGQEIRIEVQKFDSRLDKIISENPEFEVIADGLSWSEGPLWLEKEQMLLFSDVPANTIYKVQNGRKEIYLQPSGYTSPVKRGGETGSNGLLLSNSGRLILCQHGDRRIAEMDAPISNPSAKFKTIAGSYNGKKFDSPNDAVINKKGEVYFTDPPYGLEKNVNDPLKEIPFQGVYKTTVEGKVTLLTDSITRPNGIAFFPGEKQLLIANCDGKKPFWYIYDVTKQGTLSNGRVFYSALKESKTERGLPDGLKIDQNGNVFATGPGGVWIFDKNGTLLGKIKVNDLTSNCALSNDRTLYITANKRVLKVKLK